MRARQPLPSLWLMTDERQRDPLAAIGRLPRAAGIVFRHYGLPERERRRLFAKLRALARRRGLVLLLAGPPARAASWRADGSHGLCGGKASPAHLLRSASAHDAAELRAAERAGAHLVFVSPVFATRSHPGARPLGPLRFGLLARLVHIPVIALGGMDAKRARRTEALGAYGWAGIDAWD